MGLTKFSERQLVCIEEIRGAMASGAVSRMAVADKLGWNYNKVMYYDAIGGLNLPTNRHVKRKTLVENLRRAASGAESFGDILKEIDLSFARIKNVAREEGIRLPEDAKNFRGPMKRREDIDCFIRQGLTQQEISDRVGWSSRERTRQYILATGQHGVWAEAKIERKKAIEKEKQQRIKTLEHLVSVLKINTIQSAGEISWAYQGAIKYFLDHKFSYSFEDLLKVLERYQNVKEEGRKLSLKKLVEGTSVGFPTLGLILYELGERPFYLKRKNISQEKIDAIRKGLDLAISSRDVAYFLNVSPFIVSSWWSKTGPIPKYSVIKSFNISRKRICELTLRLASQVYEADDAGFNSEEIKELLDVKMDEVLDHARENRGCLGRRIKKVLRVLYRKRSVSTPYRTPDLVLP